MTIIPSEVMKQARGLAEQSDLVKGSKPLKLKIDAYEIIASRKRIEIILNGEKIFSHNRK